jgi:hypothetical protein
MINIKAWLGLSYFTSALDEFLANFDKSHLKLSASQRLEKEKYARIYQLRDQAKPATPPTSTIWEQF